VNAETGGGAPVAVSGRARPDRIAGSQARIVIVLIPDGRRE
jgi:hypothetical protein